jgi:hypothetical protein
LENRKESRNEKELILFGNGNVVRQTLEEDYPDLNAALYSDAKNRWVVILSCQDSSLLESFKDLGQFCIRRINEFVKVNISAELCSTSGHANQLHILYMETEDILEQKAIYGGNRLLHVYIKYVFRDYIEKGAVEYVQVDVTRVAGITEWLQVAGLAAAYDLPVCPHVGDMGQIHQHLVAATSNAIMLEYIPWIRHIFEEPATVKDGYYVLPRQPGASTTIIPRFLDEYRVK